MLFFAKFRPTICFLALVLLLAACRSGESYRQEAEQKAEQGRYTEALEAYNLAMERIKDEPLLHYERGQVLYTLGDYWAALWDFGRAIALAPDFSQAYFARGLANRAVDQNRSAADDFLKVMALEPEKPEPYWLHAQLYYEVGNFSQARADLTRYFSLTDDPDPAALEMWEQVGGDN
jgi:tetratricopeptide (TPR) repeat protein